MENFKSNGELKDLKDRTKEFSLRIIRLCQSLPRNQETMLIGKQLFRSGTSVGANTRSAFRGRSKREFVAKVGVIIEEADESQYWMELLAESGMMRPEPLQPMIKEAGELVSIFVSIYKKNKE